MDQKGVISKLNVEKMWSLLGSRDFEQIFKKNENSHEKRMQTTEFDFRKATGELPMEN